MKICRLRLRLRSKLPIPADFDSDSDSDSEALLSETSCISIVHTYECGEWIKYIANISLESVHLLSIFVMSLRFLMSLKQKHYTPNKTEGIGAPPIGTYFALCHKATCFNGVGPRALRETSLVQCSAYCSAFLSEILTTPLKAH